MFLMNLQANQQMRVNRRIIESLVKEASEKVGELMKEVKELKDKIDSEDKK